MTRFFPKACCVLLAMACAANAQVPARPMGKFYIVGMGTAPDLITLRAQKAIAQAGIILLDDGDRNGDWAAMIKGKEIWTYTPHDLRRYYGIDPKTLPDAAQRAQAEAQDAARKALSNRIRSAVEQGKTIACLEGGDPMMYGFTLFLELLPPDLPSEVVPGIGAFQAASAAVKMEPPYGYDTSAVILTMGDWPGRVDTNEKLMAAGSTMVFYTMSVDYPSLFAQLKRYYAEDTPVAIVSDAGDLARQKVIRSTVGKFLTEVDYKSIPMDRHLLMVGKFLKVGQARKDALVPRSPAPAPKK